MRVPYVMLLLYVGGGPHDGHTRQASGFVLEHGDCVTCDCHMAVYKFQGRDDRGFYVVEYAPEQSSVLLSNRQSVVAED